MNPVSEPSGGGVSLNPLGHQLLLAHQPITVPLAGVLSVLIFQALKPGDQRVVDGMVFVHDLAGESLIS
jgi:hypothetical protein